jgi:acyl-lipid omega-6 desaturase (Delta-12 desaturase)
LQDLQIMESLKDWRSILQKYQRPDTKKAVIQLINSYMPFLGLWVLMYFSLNWSYWITLGLAAINAFFLVRIFIIQHDCGHQSFLKSRKLNNVIGLISSFFSSIPYKYWSRTHNAHHAHNGQLEHRGLGDIYYLTTDEYRHLSRWAKIRYRIFRSPVMLFLVVPVAYLTVTLRFPFVKLKGWNKIRWSYYLNNLMVLAVYTGLAFVLGWQKFLMVHIPVLMIFGIIAFWFFYVQHQHEENYKEWKNQWDHLLASIKGSTFYKLPKMFQWLTGNIGFHHIHHLSSKIPNYRLEACASENPILNEYVNTVSFRKSLACMRYKLWDPEKQQMISFSDFRNASFQTAPAETGGTRNFTFRNTMNNDRGN